MQIAVADVKDFGPIVFQGLAFLLALVSFTAVTTMAWLNLRVAKQQAETSKRQAETSKHQAALARTKLTLDLFDRRVKVYDEIWEISKDVYAGMPFDESRASRFSVITKDIGWLFSEQMKHFISGSFYVALYTANSEIQTRKRHPKVRGNQGREWSGRLADLMAELPARFGPFLQIEVNPPQHIEDEEGRLVDPSDQDDQE